MTGKIGGPPGEQNNSNNHNVNTTNKKGYAAGRIYTSTVENKPKLFIKNIFDNIVQSVKTGNKKVSHDLLVLSFPIKTTEKTRKKANGIIMSIHRSPRGIELEKLLNVDKKNLNDAIDKLFDRLDNPEASIKLAKKALLEEIGNSPIDKPGELLRSNSLATKLTSAFASKYMTQILKDLLAQTLMYIPTEKPDDKVANKTYRKIAFDLSKNLLNICSESKDPNFQEFKNLCKLAYETASETFGEEVGKKVAVNILILRFALPAIINPKKLNSFGIKYEDEQQKNAISASILIQKTVSKPTKYTHNSALERVLDQLAKELLS